METEQTCPFCHRVHYSVYNADRCAAQHGALIESPKHVMSKRPKHMLTGTDAVSFDDLSQEAGEVEFRLQLPQPETGQD